MAEFLRATQSIDYDTVSNMTGLDRLLPYFEGTKGVWYDDEEPGASNPSDGSDAATPSEGEGRETE
ncbi:MAG: hypothetical protein ACYTKD_24635 [Planctomycetota bacterium]